MDRADVSQDEVKELTEQFYVTLRAYVARLRAEDQARPSKSFQQIQELLKRKDWSAAYEIEQLIVDLFDDPTLEIELQNRLLEAESSLRPKLAAYYAKLAAARDKPEQRRPLLARLVNDLQWRYTVNEVKRTYSKEITKSTGVIFITAIALFTAVVVGMAFIPPLQKLLIERDTSALLLLAGLAGGWGAGFSMLASLKERLDSAGLNDLKLMRSGWILWSRPLIGVGAACILLFFMTSGLLGGTAFPNFAAKQGSSASAQVAAGQPAPAATTDGSTQSPQMQISLLIVWCFIAGFSERLVPALIAKTEDRAGSAPDRYKPEPPSPGDKQDGATASVQPGGTTATETQKVSST
ncbi:MAG: hypothetical protein ACREXX_20250 [Gammaproteobacteria bacterium]